MTIHIAKPNAVIIGRRPAAFARRPTAATARDHSRTSVPLRIPHDFYPTPPEATRALLSVEPFDGSVWEPACGEGAIARVLTDAGHTVVSTDLHAYGFGIPGVDFLAETTPRARNIITNPPYGRGLADAFVLHSLRLTALTKGKVALLLNLSSLCHPSRTPLWRRLPPARIYAMDGIVCWPEHRYGSAPAAFTRHRYAWCVWEPPHQGSTYFGWLSASDFR